AYHRRPRAGVTSAAQGGAGGRIARHAVDGAAGEHRGAAEVQALQRRRVRRELGHRAEDDLDEAIAAAAHVAADQVRVARLQGVRAELVAGEDAVAEAGREALDRRLHVDAAVVVGPGGVLAL